MLKKFFFSLLVLVFCGAAVAQQTCKQYQATYWIFESGWQSTKALACSALVGKSEKSGETTWSVTSASLNAQGQCAIKATGVTPNQPNQTENTSVAVSERTLPGPCQTVCQAQKDQTKTLNWTTGYTRSANIDTDPNWTAVSENPVPANRNVCDPSQPCMMELGSTPKANYQSASPTPTGLYRLSTDFLATYTGEACTPGPSDTAGLSPNAAIPPCPGFVGEVNGKPGCFGTADSPTRNDKPIAKPMPPEAGNPAAGPKPSTGEGSGTGGAGRTPSTGNGGPAGGPAGAAGPNAGPGEDDGDGTTDKPEDGKEQKACGAPGQAKCRIDETGTPDGKGVFDQHRDKLENEGQKMTDELEKIKGTTDKDTSWGTTPTWIQHAACSPWDLGTFQIAGRSISVTVDMCPVMPWVVGVMNFIWAVGTFFAVLAMVFRVTTATAG